RNIEIKELKAGAGSGSSSDSPKGSANGSQGSGSITKGSGSSSEPGSGSGSAVTDRTVTEWALRKGATVRVVGPAGGLPVPVKKLADLPKGEFNLFSVAAFPAKNDV